MPSYGDPFARSDKPLAATSTLTASPFAPALAVSKPKTTTAKPAPLPDPFARLDASAPIKTSSGLAPTMGPPPPPPLQSPGNNLTNPGYTEQALEYTQNRLLEDPAARQMQTQYQNTQSPTQGENYMNQNLGTLDGPGQGDQYWNQVQGQFNSPFAGEQFTREATQNMSPNGPASAFYGQAMGQFDQRTNYGGGNQAQGQYQQNAGSGPLAGQQFYNSVQGDYGTTGTYSDPNLSAGQYGQTQQAFGDLPIAEFDPFYDRARQLGVQSYNQGAAGRGVYGSSEALSGVGNVITDIEAQRANRSFDAEMQRSQEQRMRQQLLGEQAQMGDKSSLAAFGANLAGVETFGNLANAAGNQTLGQQTMLGNQARQADVTGLDAFEAERRGLETFGSLAGQADSTQTNRYQATTGAMDAADRTGLARTGLGADIAFRGDDSARADYTAGADVADRAAGRDIERTRLGADIASTASRNDLARLDSTMSAANTAEDDRQARQNTALDAMAQYTGAVQQALQSGFASAASGEYQSFEDWFNAEMAPSMQDASFDQQDKDQLRKDAMAVWDAAKGA